MKGKVISREDKGDLRVVSWRGGDREEKRKVVEDMVKLGWVRKVWDDEIRRDG